MEFSEALRKRIKGLLDEHNISISKLSTKAAICRSTVTKFLAGRTKTMKMETIVLICEGLGIKMKDFFDSPVFDNIEVKD